MALAAGVDYPGSYAELRAWFDEDWKCLDYLDWLRASAVVAARAMPKSYTYIGMRRAARVPQFGPACSLPKKARGTRTTPQVPPRPLLAPKTGADAAVMLPE